MWTLLSLFLFVGALDACEWLSHITVTAPGGMEALRGGCLQIPCTFTATEELNDGTQIAGVWVTNENNIGTYPSTPICNSGVTNCQNQMEIIGNLRQKNCTTLFGKLPDYERIYFRIESSDFKATAPCSPVQLTIRDSISPEIHVPAELKEAESVTITCSAPAPCPHSPPTLTWNLQANAQHKLEQNPDGTITVKIQQTFTLSEQHDGDDITCSATYPVDDGGTKRAERKETLSVSYAPKNTSASVSPSAVVSAGSSVTLSCSSRAKPPVRRFTWFRRSGGGDSAESEEEVYTFNVTKGGVYYCVAANALGSQSSEEIQLTVPGLSGEGPDVMMVTIVVGAAVSILFVFVCALVIFKRCRSSRPEQNLIQSQTAEPAGNQENLHYGEITFKKAKSDVTPDPAQGDRGQQDTVYAQVQVVTPAPAAGNTNDIYAEVKKK